MNKKIKPFIFILLFIICIFCLCGCQTTDKSESYFDDGKFNQTTYDYNVITNETEIIFNATLTNNTIYNVNGFSIKIRLYRDSSLINTESYNYTKVVKNGASYTGNFRFYADGEINYIEFVSWSANYDSFFKTYKAWFITCIILLSISIIVYILFMIFEDVNFFDIWDFIDDSYGYILSIIIPLIVTVIIFVSTSVFNWIPCLIVTGTILSFIILALIFQLIKYLVDLIRFGKNIDDENPQSITSTNYSDEDYDNLMQLSKEQLITYCRKNKLSGYSKLNKSELIDLIISSIDEFNESTEIETEETDNPTEQTAPTRHETNALDELDSLIGLGNVKNQLKRIRAVLLKNKNSSEPLNLHMCFYGNPGTGKTVVARLMANIFYEVGVLPTNKLIETDRSGLCGQYLGQTAPLTHKKVKQAMGGVLFIDEAYTLYSDGVDNDYGKEAIAALLKDMEDYKGKFCVIFAGYKNEMEKMIAVNPGLDSRINRKIDFPDYTIEELIRIFDVMMIKNNYDITDEARTKLSEILVKESKSKNFANARTVRNILSELMEIQALRTINDDERIIKIEDVERYCEEN